MCIYVIVLHLKHHLWSTLRNEATDRTGNILCVDLYSIPDRYIIVNKQ